MWIAIEASPTARLGKSHENHRPARSVPIRVGQVLAALYPDFHGETAADPHPRHLPVRIPAAGCGKLKGTRIFALRNFLNAPRQDNPLQ
jgi:hypothetical protein